MPKIAEQNLMPMNPVSSDIFSVSQNGREKVMVTEMSTLEGNGGELTRMYRDSIDLGIAIKSERTGKVVNFVVVGRDVVDGEIQGWHLRPLKGMFIDRDAGYRVLIIND
jgi:hypothetical protein